MHRAGKLLLKESLAYAIQTRVALPLTFENDCYHKSHSVPNMIPASADSVDEEVPLQGQRPDLVLKARDRVLIFLEVIVTHPPGQNVYRYGVPVVEFRLTGANDLRMVDASLGTGLHASRVANPTPSKKCVDLRKPCRRCGAPVRGHYSLCYNCALHSCGECGSSTTSKGKFCSVDCAAAAQGMAVCSCGNWHSDQYSSCYECGSV